ncbi:class I adenylate-forming enzyme family protein [Mycobacterium hubeiense]|uniref:class I adenylate-forming enzyme family protein n=1 Tax=Mycobacterium hubeiense TaxID=1867256 RepID=UPI0021014F01|nr:class I adenylate-forming enzyme family protein [Mycobacterium sp. QGD 101]
MQLLHDLVSTAATIAPQRLAVVSADGTTATFEEFNRQVRAVAGWVAGHTRPRDRVAVIADNSVAYAHLYYGVPRSGRVLVLINQRLSPGEQAAQLASTGPAIVVGDSHYLAALPDIADQVPSIQRVVELDSDEWSLATQDEPRVSESPRPDDPAWLLFTSGSTGTPKEVVHTHRSLLAAVPVNTRADRSLRAVSISSPSRCVTSPDTTCSFTTQRSRRWCSRRTFVRQASQSSSLHTV